MKVLTWNINGIRAVTGKSGVQKLLQSLDADVVCLQETKVTRDMLDEPTAIVDGYESYFSFSRKRTGYSGTANYCAKQCTPVCAEEGLTGRLQTDEESCVGCYGNTSAYSDKELDALDAEGRCVITQHRIRLSDGSQKDVAIINVYVPRAGDRPERLVYKLKFLTLLRSRAQALLRQNIHVIILGDLNLTHTALDNCDPESDADFLRRSSRIWINNLLQPCERDPKIARSHPDLEAVALNEDDEVEDEEAEMDLGMEKDGKEEKLKACTRKEKSINTKDVTGNKDRGKQEDLRLSFSDVYRRLHPEEATGYTNWDTSTDARKSNYGRRLDYILVDYGLAGLVKDCQILTEVHGSDHCPVLVTLDCCPLPFEAPLPPQMCSKLMPEFRGQQQKLSSFFTKTAAKMTGRKNDHGTDLQSSSESSPSSSQEEKHDGTTSLQQLKKSASVPVTLKSSSEERAGLKRSMTSNKPGSGAPLQKKAKQTTKQEGGPRQASLSAFFAPKSSTTSSSKQVLRPESNKSAPDNLKCKTGGRRADQISSEEDNSVICVEDTITLETNSTKSVSEPKTVPSHVPAKQIALSSAPKDSGSCAQTWKSLLSGPAPPPLCPGHKEPCVLKTVRKNGPNKNKQFYSCPRPDGPPGNTQFRCNFFQWFHDHQKKKT